MFIVVDLYGRYISEINWLKTPNYDMLIGAVRVEKTICGERIAHQSENNCGLEAEPSRPQSTELLVCGVQMIASTHTRHAISYLPSRDIYHV